MIMNRQRIASDFNHKSHFTFAGFIILNMIPSMVSPAMTGDYSESRMIPSIYYKIAFASQTLRCLFCLRNRKSAFEDFLPF